jgi:nicotinate-nucleotide pyrophosphorylase (carboxylating)
MKNLANTATIRKSEILDVREEILKNVQFKQVTASIIADNDGILAGMTTAKKETGRLGLSVLTAANNGSYVKDGDEVIRFRGSPKQVVMAEEILVGLLAKPSGIATNTHKFVKATGGRPQVVCGAWKKMPPSLKDMIREAVVVGGAFYRIERDSFVYLDKNYIELLGGIKDSLSSVAHLNNHSKVVQVKGRSKDVVSEACEAAVSGADIVFIDTGKPDDVPPVAERLRELGLRSSVKLAFGGGVTLETIGRLKTLDIDIVDIGRQIGDAPLLDMRLEIIDS